MAELGQEGQDVPLSRGGKDRSRDLLSSGPRGWHSPRGHLGCLLTSVYTGSGWGPCHGTCWVGPPGKPLDILDARDSPTTEHFQPQMFVGWA